MVRSSTENCFLNRTSGVTPDISFEVIVKKQTSLLREPSLKCIQWVVRELTHIVHECSEKLSRYPRLRKEVERLITSRIYEREQVARSQINLMVNIEMSYININHEEFIAFGSVSDNQSIRKPVQIIRKGYLGLHNINVFEGRSKDFWFVLTTETFAWYKDDEEKEKEHSLSLEKLKYQDIESKSHKLLFGIISSDSKNVYKEYKQLELSTSTADDVEQWKASFLRAGVYPERISSSDKDNVDNQLSQTRDDVGFTDPVVDREVEMTRKYIESYLKIVHKTQRDLVPKIIMHVLVNHVGAYVESDLVTHLFSSANQAELMEESAGEASRRDQLIRMYQTTKEALTIISELLAPTTSTPLPPPIVDNDERNESSPLPYECGSHETPRLKASSLRLAKSEPHPSTRLPLHRVINQAASSPPSLPPPVLPPSYRPAVPNRQPTVPPRPTSNLLD